MAEPTSFAGPWNEVVTKPQHESEPFLGPGNNAFIFLCRVVVKGPRMSKSLDRIIKLIFALIALVNGIPNCLNVYLHVTLFTTLSRLLQKAGKVGHFGAVCAPDRWSARDWPTDSRI